jgi:hypothetical protein
MAEFFSSFNRSILRLTIRAGSVANFFSRYRNKIQAVAGAVALGLGFWGWMIEKPPADLSGVLDNVFRTAQLVTLQFPTDLRGSPSLPLQIARLAVPIVAVLASFQVLIASVTRPARLALLPHIAGHVVVCGSSSMTEKALMTLAASGRQVVIVISKITGQQRDNLEGFGLTVVDADPMQSRVIRSLHLSRAAAVFLLDEDDIANLNIGMLVLQALDDRPAEFPPLRLAVKIDREELAVELDAAFDGLSRRHGAHYHRLSPAREGLRLELQRFAPALLKTDIDTASHVLVVGLAGDWRQMASQIIVTAQDHPDKRPVLTFAVDQAEADAIGRWRRAKPELDQVVEIVILPRETAAPLPADGVIAPWREKYPRPHLAVVLRADVDAIASALALRRPASPLATDTIPILLHQTKEDRLLRSLATTDVKDRDMTRLAAIGGLIRAESIDRVLDRKGDEMAIAVHAHYVAASNDIAPGSTAALGAWDDLPENLRDANRAAVEHIPILLAAAGYRLLPAQPDIRAVPPAAAAIERMARVEHRRWMADRIDRGWRFGKLRDDRQMLHPDLIPFDLLSEGNKEKDRNSVRVLLSIVATQGLVVVRSTDSV